MASIFQPANGRYQKSQSRGSKQIQSYSIFSTNHVRAFILILFREAEATISVASLVIFGVNFCSCVE